MKHKTWHDLGITTIQGQIDYTKARLKEYKEAGHSDAKDIQIQLQKYCEDQVKERKNH